RPMGNILNERDERFAWLMLLEIADGGVVDDREDLSEVLIKDFVVEDASRRLVDHPRVLTDFTDELVDLTLQVVAAVSLAEQDFSTPAIDVLTLGIENVVVLENVLSSFEEVVLDALLSLGDH